VCEMHVGGQRYDPVCVCLCVCVCVCMCVFLRERECVVALGE